MLDVPAIAMSQHIGDGSRVQWATAAAYAPEVIRRLTALPWPRHTLINVNFPDVPPDQVNGIAATRAGPAQDRRQSERAHRSARPAPITGSGRCATRTHEPGPAPISRAVADGKVALTPIHLDLTNAQALAALKQAFP